MKNEERQLKSCLPPSPSVGECVLLSSLPASKIWHCDFDELEMHLGVSLLELQSHLAVLLEF